MDFVAHIGDVLMLENKQNYMVLHHIEYKNEGYLFVCNVATEANPNFEYRFVKEIVKDGKYFLSTVEDRKMIAELFDEMQLNVKNEQ